MLSLKLFVVGTLLAFAEDARLNELVRNNASSVGLLRTIDVKLESENGTQIWWIKDGSRERIRSTSPSFPVGADRNRPMRSDLLNDGGDYKLLRNWDPDNPIAITPLDQAGVSAETGPRVTDGTLAAD